ncbi:MAG: hypothetical protein HKN16_04255, partial [Saprospiraceae bacterium]|nr:hypothetical protein [Saprospiraceae bacterium]
HVIVAPRNNGHNAMPTLREPAEIASIEIRKGAKLDLKRSGRIILSEASSDPQIASNIIAAPLPWKR